MSSWGRVLIEGVTHSIWYPENEMTAGRTMCRRLFVAVHHSNPNFSTGKTTRKPVDCMACIAAEVS